MLYSSLLFLAASAPLAIASPSIRPKNFIFVIPDGMAPASQTLVRTYLDALNGGMGIDKLPLGNVRTHSANNLVTDSAAAGTAFASGIKTNNGAIGVTPEGLPVGTIMEAAKMEGFLTGLVATSPISHATPAAFSSHVNNRNAFPQIAEQQIGYSHPLNQSVDLMLGGGRCFFQPSTASQSCRNDTIDLFGYAESNGYYVAQNREQFDRLQLGRGEIQLPYLGLFTDGDMSYEIDRQQQPESVREPSLVEMSTAALNSLERGLACKGRKCRNKHNKGYFLMIEASRIDHSSHAHDGVAHLHDTLQYNAVMDLVKAWIDEHPDTIMISVADHETGGLTLPSRYNVNALKSPTHSVEYLNILWTASSSNATSDRASLLRNTILPAYGVTDASEAEVTGLVNSGNNFRQNLADALNRRSGLKWSTGGHTGVDTTLYAYAKGRMGEELKARLAGGYDNTELPRFIEEVLRVDMEKVTRALRAKGTGWVP